MASPWQPFWTACWATGSAASYLPALLRLYAWSWSWLALPVAQQAVTKGCEAGASVSPCGYALYELARAQLGTGDAGGAVATLNQRLQRYPDDQRKTVEKLLKKAQKDAEKG